MRSIHAGSLRLTALLGSAAVLASGTLPAGTTQAVAAVPARPGTPPAPQVDRPVPGGPWTPAAPGATAAPGTTPQSSVSVPPAPWQLPTPGGYRVDLSSGTSQSVGATGITLRAVGPGQVGAVTVDVLDRASAVRRRLAGVVLRVARADGSTAAAQVEVGVPPTVLAGAYGANYAARVRFVQLADTGLADVGVAGTALVPAGQAGSDVLLSPTIGGAAVLVATTSTSLATNGTGDFGATSLSPSSAWQVSPQTGSFSWSYPLRVPPAAAGPEPDLALSYDSGAVDGKTGSTNNQPSAVGEGWDLAGGGFIERSYVPCSDDGISTSGDECWKSDNATLSLGGHSGVLVKDATTGTWRLTDDDGTRVQRLTGTVNGDNDGEYWLLTTTDGTKYYFGLNHLPGWASGKPTTQSAWTVPVFGNNAGEPCHGTTFPASACNQGWRWNLDYIVDSHDNSEALYYTPETNLYAENGTTATSYVRGGMLARIDFGMRKNSELTSPAPQRVVFTTANRCIPGSTCDSAHPASWPDVPWDQNCSAAPCTGRISPTFWSTKRLSTVQTQYLAGTGYQNVELWTLTQSYPDPRDGSSAALWLAAISHIGQVGGTATMPDVQFTGTLYQNRYWAVDGVVPLNKERISSIRTDTGARISVNYLPAECSSTNIPSAPESNTMRCFPQRWAPPGFTPRLDWFNKYPVSSVVADPVTGGAQPTDQTYYDYSLGTPRWRYDTSPVVKDKDRTWSVFAGYSTVRVSHGDVNTPSLRETTNYTYFQGMDGDRAGPSGGTRSVSVAASDGSTVTDSLWWAGRIREQISYRGVGGPQVGGQISTPWASAPTADDGVTTARHTGDADVVSRTALSAGGFRTTEVKTGYDGNGRPTAVSDLADTSTAADDQCTRTSYADNTATGLLDFPAEIATVAKTCTATPSYPGDAVSDARTYYDGSATLGAAPSRGDATRTDVARSYSGSTPQWLTTASNSYDMLGRATATTDALGRTTTTAYTPAAAGPLTREAVTNPMGWTTTTTYHPAWGTETSVTDQNNHATTGTYDPLGRRTQVWLPDRPQAANPSSPSLTFGYAVQANGPVSVATTTLTPNGSISTSYELFDGLLRPRQTQAPSEAGGAVVTDTLYDAAGRATTSYHKYYIGNVPSGSLFVPLQASDIPGATQTAYDGAGRITAQILLIDGSERWRTSYAQGGDHVDVTPPTGGTPTTTYTDARGNTTRLLQYHGTTPSGTADATTYGYDPSGHLTAMTDPAGNHWTWSYDLLGRQTAAADPDKGATVATYDDAGRMTSSTDARTITLAYSYDAADRRTGEYLDTTSGTRLASWTYDTLSKGQLTSSTRYSGSDSYTVAATGYDAADRPTGTSVTLPASQGALAGTYTTTLTYDVDGSLATQQDPAAGGLPAETIASSYTALGHLAEYAGRSAYLFTISYGGLNEVTQTRHYNGINSLWDTYSYQEGTRRLAHLTANTNATSSNVATDRSYGYDDAGDITSIADAPAGQSPDTQCFGYDYLQRLTEAWTPASGGCAGTPAASNLGGPAPYWNSYRYDLVGNRLSQTRHSATGGPDATDTYSYPAPGSPRPHAVQTVTHTGAATGADSYGYDPAGDTIGRPGQTLAWDDEGHLASTAAGGQTQTNIYDADGNLLIRADPTGSTAYLGDTELHLAAGSTTVTGARTYTALGSPCAVRTTAAGVAGSTVTWLDSDPQGTADVSVNPATDAITARHFDPFGNPRDSGTPAWPDAHGFLNKPTDPFTGTTHLGARDYEPALGRFLSVDPVLDPFQPQQGNAYSYAQNNPVTDSDPTGLIRQDDGGCSPYCVTSSSDYYGAGEHSGRRIRDLNPPPSRRGDVGDDPWNNPAPRCQGGSYGGACYTVVGHGEREHYHRVGSNCGGYSCSHTVAGAYEAERKANIRRAARAAAAAAARKQHHHQRGCGFLGTGCLARAVSATGHFVQRHEGVFATVLATGICLTPVVDAGCGLAQLGAAAVRATQNGPTHFQENLGDLLGTASVFYAGAFKSSMRELLDEMRQPYPPGFRVYRGIWKLPESVSGFVGCYLGGC